MKRTRAPAAVAGEASSLGAVIRSAREKHELTLQQVAERTRLSVSYLSQIERDLLHPSVSTLKRIAQALGIAAGKLMFPAPKAAGGGASSPSAACGEVRSR